MPNLRIDAPDQKAYDADLSAITKRLGVTEGDVRALQNRISTIAATRQGATAAPPPPASGGIVSGITSVGLTVPSIFSTSNNPLTSSGLITLSLATQTANFGFFGPTSGGAATPAFRAPVTADIPDGIVTVPKLSASGTPSGTTFLRGDGAWAIPAGAAAGSLQSLTVKQVAAGTATIALTDDVALMTTTAATTLTVTVCSAAAAGGGKGWAKFVKRIDSAAAGVTNIVPTGAETFLMGTTTLTTFTVTSGASVVLVSDGVSVIEIMLF